ncbi:unnamed protein product [Mytilus coruscus]|uniref:TIR domain-containing protein n=1 Tax=Mytilus coruscus TaxID=42192 RepID=A0A6J8E7M4_MYTCO|nr:unnamed protein product [Mytilus coruscus]
MKELAESLPKSNSPITRAAECGPENATIIIQRGISIEIKEDPDEWKQFNSIKFACNVSNYANEDRHYDAFIAYSEKDVDWVLHSAIPMLETEETGKTFRLCLHHRDFEIGETISNNIIKSVENSHHTILLISNDFLTSEWCMMEFRTALQKILQDKNRHMILIMKDIVTTDNIDPDLKTCINCHTHLDIRDFLFWDKLK